MKEYRGMSASSGVAKGIGLYLNQLQEEKLTGDVIVVEEYIPPHIVELPECVAGIVTEDGGILSHAACMARELGIPCIVSVKGAREALQGKWIEVDAGEGVVRVLDQDSGL